MYSMALGPRFFKWKMLSLSGPNALLFLQLLIALRTVDPVVNVCAIFKDLLFVSLVTNRVSLEKVCLTSFDVLNCLLNLVDSCLDDENEIPLKVIASFSVSRFVLPSIPLIVLHSLVTSVFWSKGLNKISSPFVCVDEVLDVIIQSWQFRRGWISFTGGHLVLSSHPISLLVQVPQWSLCRPVRMWCDAALSRTVWKIFSSL